MEQPHSFIHGPEYIALLDKLVEGGWISQVIRHESGHFLISWTARGVQGASLMRSIARDLSLGPKGLHSLLVFCELHGKDLPEDLGN